MSHGKTAANLIGYLGRATHWGREIWAPVESSGHIPVSLQDQHSRALDLYFVQQLAATTLSTAAAAGNKTLTLANAAGFIDGVVVFLTDGAGTFTFAQQVGAPAENIITLDRPTDLRSSAGTTCFAMSKDMAVDGSSTTQVFQIGPVGTDFEIDVTRIMGHLQTGSALDDSLFGNLAALTNGIQLRINSVTSVTNLWNIKSNGEISLTCYDALISDRAPAGKYGLRFRNTFSGQEKHGVTLRLSSGDQLEILIQDDLSALDMFNMMAQGHYVSD